MTSPELPGPRAAQEQMAEQGPELQSPPWWYSPQPVDWQALPTSLLFNNKFKNLLEVVFTRNIRLCEFKEDTRTPISFSWEEDAGTNVHLQWR